MMFALFSILNGIRDSAVVAYIHSSGITSSKVTILRGATTAMQQSSFDTIKYQFPLFEKCLINAFFNYEKSYYYDIMAYREKSLSS